jgi:endonuclease I
MFTLEDFKRLSQIDGLYNYDIYTGNPLPHGIPRSHNWEHVIPAFIIGKRVGMEDEKLSLNKEPYHDPHLVYPTLKVINDERNNFPYGQLVQDRYQAFASPDIDLIANEGRIIATQHIRDMSLLGDERKDIYIKNKDRQRICDFGKCIFQPPIQTRGAIARAVFYFYLMYGYDSFRRPYTGHTPWLFHGVIDNNVKQYDIIDNNWRIFFEHNIDMFREWASEPITKEEERRNIDIIKITHVPNIFVSYIDNDMNYTTANSHVINELFFGKPHIHDTYKNMSFFDNLNVGNLQYVYNNVVKMTAEYFENSLTTQFTPPYQEPPNKRYRFARYPYSQN